MQAAEHSAFTMKKIFLLSLLAAPLAIADISMGVTQQPEAGQSTGVEAAEYVSMAQEVISSLNELTATLMGVHDKASADAAAAKVNEQTSRMLALQAKSESLPPPTPEVEMQVRSSLNVQQVQKTVQDFLGAVIKLGMSNAYGSEELLRALGPIVNAMPGQTE